MPFLLLLLFSIALSVGIGIIGLVIRRARQNKAEQATGEPFSGGIHEGACMFRRPSCWLAVKSRSLVAVQSALGLSNVKPCSWVEGFAGEEKLFIAPPVKGWILVMGSGLPDPGDDVDIFFRFMLRLSRRLGQVQFFAADRVSRHHAWIKADAGRIVRAYAWAGLTLWQQGRLTSAEKELDLKSFNYFESVEPPPFGKPDVFSINSEKVPLLAARWSLDPARIDQRCLQSECGVAGELARRY